jgi:BCCT family betaine/carnitine transporter
MIRKNLLNKDWNPTLIIIPILLSFLISLYVLIDVDKSKETLGYLYSAASIKLENIYELGAFGVIVFLLLLCVLPIGSKKILLNERPIFSNLSWGAMMFVSGMGASILWAAPVEWASTINSKPFGLDSSSIGIIEYSQAYPLFHWGFVGWALYALPGVAFTIAVLKNPRVQLSFGGILVKGNNLLSQVIRNIFDIVFILAILAGAGVGMGVSFPVIAEMTSYLIGIDNSFLFQVIILFICLGIFGTSVYKGLEGGIKRLSNINVTLVFILLSIVLLVGPTQFIIDNSIESTSFMLEKYIQMSFFSESSFAQSWTVFYWAWWMALAPFVGTFILQISNGKTIRQMILGTVFIGSFATFIHFYVLGGLTLNLYDRGIMDIPEMVKTIPSGRIALESLLTLPAGYFLIILYAFIATIFLCTTYDSCSYVLASTAMKHASKRPSKSLRLIFAILLIIQPILIMSLEGIDSIKYILVLSSIPLIAIYVLMILYISQNVFKN